MEVKSRRQEHAEATRAALITAARELFVARGYAATPTEEIVRRARVTRGALYHHFADKAALFRAVFEEVDRHVVSRVNAAALKEADPWERLVAGCLAFLDVCLDPEVQRIVLTDGPAVLGWDVWRKIESRSCTRQVRRGLQASIKAGLMRPQPVEPLSHIIFGALIEAGLLVAQADDVDLTRAEVGSSIKTLLAGLKGTPI